MEPSFARANEVHLRLGLMFKSINNFEASLKVTSVMYVVKIGCFFASYLYSIRRADNIPAFAFNPY